VLLVLRITARLKTILFYVLSCKDFGVAYFSAGLLYVDGFGVFLFDCGGVSVFRSRLACSHMHACLHVVFSLS